ncbi:MAG TPA: TetR/AcrR family transcriptional regulator [Lacunisphaera sp.]|nr:TetR/AcrR family transcriptional regulator [Lacunisphaera sp.]
MHIRQADRAKNRILSAAEALFAEKGVAGVTLRQITANAHANLAAVNYHYFDKERLAWEIFLRRIRPLNAARLEALAKLEAGCGDQPVAFSAIIDAFARPLFICGSDPDGYNAHSRRLVGRIFTEPLPFAPELLGTEMQPTMTRFAQAIRRHAPKSSPADFVWRFSFVVGAMHHALATLHDMQARTNGICRNNDAEAALRNFIAFGVQAFT